MSTPSGSSRDLVAKTPSKNGATRAILSIAGTPSIIGRIRIAVDYGIEEEGQWPLMDRLLWMPLTNLLKNVQFSRVCNGSLGPIGKSRKSQTQKAELKTAKV
jgi:hypothetical protein